jgi:hypothetical protein
MGADGQRRNAGQQKALEVRARGSNGISRRHDWFPCPNWYGPERFKAACGDITVTVDLDHAEILPSPHGAVAANLAANAS